jgi:hypothetical protein
MSDNTPQLRIETLDSGMQRLYHEHRGSSRAVEWADPRTGILTDWVELTESKGGYRCPDCGWTQAKTEQRATSEPEP